jgi:microsomal dipeptidase-like Zn-dependent dipeptidase
MNRLGMIVDVSHRAPARTTCEVSKAPIVASHPMPVLCTTIRAT